MTYCILEPKLDFLCEVIRPNKKPKKIRFSLSGDQFAFVRVNDLVKIKRKTELCTVFEREKSMENVFRISIDGNDKKKCKNEKQQGIQNVNGRSFCCKG